MYRIHHGYKIEKYHLAVFYLASLESFVLFMHWVNFQEVELHFVALYLHVNQVCFPTSCAPSHASHDVMSDLVFAHMLLLLGAGRQGTSSTASMVSVSYLSAFPRNTLGLTT